MKTCNTCRKEYSDRKSFCMSCGTSLVKVIAVEGKSCPDCGVKNPDEFSFCKGCGRQLCEAQQPEKVIEPIVAEQNEPISIKENEHANPVVEEESVKVACPKCYAINNAGFDYCSKCGEKLNVQVESKGIQPPSDPVIIKDDSLCDCLEPDKQNITETPSQDLPSTVADTEKIFEHPDDKVISGPTPDIEAQSNAKPCSTEANATEIKQSVQAEEIHNNGKPTGSAINPEIPKMPPNVRTPVIANVGAVTPAKSNVLRYALIAGAIIVVVVAAGVYFKLHNTVQAPIADTTKSSTGLKDTTIAKPSPAAPIVEPSKPVDVAPITAPEAKINDNQPSRHSKNVAPARKKLTRTKEIASSTGAKDKEPDAISKHKHDDTQGVAPPSRDDL